MPEAPTCGAGLASHAPFYDKLASAVDAMAAVLDLHTSALDDDPGSRPELDAYRSLVDGQRSLAAGARAIGAEMAGYRDLPLAEHDWGLMAGPAFSETFRRFVAAEGELLDELREALDDHRRMLG